MTSRESKRLTSRGLHYVDMGTSGGVWGLERGYCLMIGGEADVVKRLDPIFAALAPGRGAIPGRPAGKRFRARPNSATCTAGRQARDTSSRWSHNGIEYGLMAAYAEGLNILQHANVGKAARTQSTPRRLRCGDPELYQYDFNVADH